VAGADGRLPYALRYAGQGWPVLPVWWPVAGGACACGQVDCSKPGRHPLVRRGFHAATLHADLINRWWVRWPRAKVGIRTGVASGLIVLDIDGAPGMEALRSLRREEGPVRAAWTRSGSGGWHAYLRMPAGVLVPNSAGRLGPRLDVLADGGSIVAPPSVHATGGRYHWLTPGVQPPEAPDWLVRLALPPPPPPVTVMVGTGGRPDSYADAAVCGEAEAVAAAPAGTRNHRLNYAAWRLGRLAAAGVVDESTAREALMAAAAACGLSRHESAGTVRGGMSAGLCNPRRPLTP